MRYLTDRYGCHARRACRTVRTTRSSVYYTSRRELLSHSEFSAHLGAPEVREKSAAAGKNSRRIAAPNKKPRTFIGFCAGIAGRIRARACVVT